MSGSRGDYSPMGNPLSDPGGTGSGFKKWVLIVAGVSALLASLGTIITMLVQAKNYRKPLLQRHVIRILVIVPIFSAASWASLTSLRVAFWIDPFRDIYEAFVLYTFFQLLINFLGGERSLIIMMHGRAPVPHTWPLNYVFNKVDISDPHTFLNIKRGILQYVWIKPTLAIVTVICKATSTFKDGKIALDSGYFWTALIYNISIFWSLYDLALFWVCMSADLQPFRPMPKFLCIKGIIFASWWQGFLLSILVSLGAIKGVGGGYTADNLAAAIQDALICFEMPLFALSHWYAFNWTDYADQTISDARMPMRFALRDAFGPRDLIEDAKETFSGKKYEYRNFDAEDNVIGHEDSSSRRARMREGMRYERGGRGKYWVPASGGSDAKQPLLSKIVGTSHARTMSPGGGRNRSLDRDLGYGTNNEPDEPELDAEEERLYTNARALEFGDWNYPVINTHYATRDDQLNSDPNMLSQTTNAAILQPGANNRARRKSRIRDLKDDVHQHNKPSESYRTNGKRGSGDSGEASSSTTSKVKEKVKQLPLVGSLLRHHSSSSSNHSRNSQLVDLVIEDHQAEEVERVRARKEGGPGWNSVEQKHFVKTFPDEEEAEEVRQGFNPDRPEENLPDGSHTLTDPFAIGDGDDDDEDRMPDANGREGTDELGHEKPWEDRKYDGKKEESADHEDYTPIKTLEAADEPVHEQPWADQKSNGKDAKKSDGDETRTTGAEVQEGGNELEHEDPWKDQESSGKQAKSVNKGEAGGENAMSPTKDEETNGKKAKSDQRQNQEKAATSSTGNEDSNEKHAKSDTKQIDGGNVTSQTEDEESSKKQAKSKKKQTGAEGATSQTKDEEGSGKKAKSDEERQTDGEDVTSPTEDEDSATWADTILPKVEQKVLDIAP